MRALLDRSHPSRSSRRRFGLGWPRRMADTAASLQSDRPCVSATTAFGLRGVRNHQHIRICNHQQGAANLGGGVMWFLTSAVVKTISFVPAALLLLLLLRPT